MTIGIPTVFLAVRLMLHAVAPKSYGPAGGYDIYTALSAGVLYTFGFIVAATLGCTAGSVDLTEGMFRHLVVTGRSRLALYLARIPAGLAIIVPLVAIGFSIVCAVCVFAAPTTLNYNGVSVPAGLSVSAARDLGRRPRHRGRLRLPLRRPPGSRGHTVRQRRRRTRRAFVQGTGRGPGPSHRRPQLRAAAVQIAEQNYSDYTDAVPLPVRLPDDQDRALARTRGGHRVHRRPRARLAARPAHRRGGPDDRARGRADPDRHPRPDIPHMENLNAPSSASPPPTWNQDNSHSLFGGGGHDFRLTESTTTAVCVILAWLVGWTVLGAWRMMTRDA